MSDEVTFGQADKPKPTRLSALREAIREQERLNSRLVRIAKPEDCIWELDMRIPTDAAELEQVSDQATDRIKKGSATAGRVQLQILAALLARFTVAIWRVGDDEPLFDARAERASAFAFEDLQADLEVKDSIAAVFALFRSDPLVIAYGQEFMSEYQGEAEALAIEDPTAGD